MRSRRHRRRVPAANRRCRQPGLERGRTLGEAPVAEADDSRVGGEALEQWSQVGGELVERDVGAHALGEAIAAGRPTEVQVVRLLRAPDDSDLGGVRPGAAVRAPRHVEPDRLPLVAGVGEQLLELVDHRRQDPFGLAQRLPARRQRRAGDRQPPQRAHVVGQRDVMPAQHREQRFGVAHAAEQEVLAGRDPDFRDQPRPNDLAERSAVVARDAAGRHREAERVTVCSTVPTVMRVDRPWQQLDRLGDGTADTRCDLGAEPLDAVLLERVLEPGPMAVVAIAEVALRGDDRLDDVGEILRWHPGDRPAEHRVRVVGPGVAHPHPAAGEHDEAGQLAGETLTQGGNDADVVRVDVDAVVARPGDADLELARQIGVAVQRLHGTALRRGLGRHRPLAVDPQLPVRRGTRPEPSHQLGDDGCQHGPPVGMGERAGHHVAHHVAAGGERREQRGIDAVHDLVQLTLRHEVVLDTLSRRQAHRTVGQLGEAVEREPLVECDHAARHRRADHARVVERELLLRSRPAHVAVVLLVDAVELEQHRALGAELVGLDQLVADRAAQIPTLGLDRLDGHALRPQLVDEHGRARRVQPALGLARTRPPARPRIVRGRRSRARPTTDRRVAAIGQRMGRQLVHGRVRGDVLVAPRGDRIDLGDRPQQVVVHHWRGGPARASRPAEGPSPTPACRPAPAGVARPCGPRSTLRCRSATRRARRRGADERFAG